MSTKTKSFVWPTRAATHLEMPGRKTREERLKEIAEKASYFGKKSADEAARLLSKEPEVVVTKAWVQDRLVDIAKGGGVAQAAIASLKQYKSAITAIWGQLSYTDESKLSQIWESD